MGKNHASQYANFGSLPIYGFLIKSILSFFKEERFGAEEEASIYYFISDD